MNVSYQMDKSLKLTRKPTAICMGEHGYQMKRHSLLSANTMSYTNLRISTLNCNGLLEKKDLIFKSLGVRPHGKLLSQHPDILLVQQTHLKESDIEGIKDEWKAHGGKHSFLRKDTQIY